MNTAQRHSFDVLLAEDDAISALYLTDALTALGCRVQHHANGAAALAAAHAQRFDLLLLDQQLPECSGMQILAALRADHAAASHGSPMIATCAGLDPAQHARLLAAGFDDALAKPLGLEQLRATLTAHAEGVRLDEAQGLAASGCVATLTALRGLLLAELADCATQFDTQLEHHPQALRARLHRLRASCGFCGATQLQQAAAALHDALGAAHLDAASVSRFRALLAATRISLRRAGARVPDLPATTPSAAYRPVVR